MRRASIAALFCLAAAAQDPAALYRQAVDLQQKGDLAAAVPVYQQLLRLDPSSFAAHSNLGAALVGLGRFTEAIPEYQAALKSAPPQFQPVLERNLALAWYKAGNYAEALPLLAKQPADRSSAMLAADCLLQLGEARKAVETLEPLAAAAGDDRAFAYVLGIAYMKAGRTADSQRVLDPVFRDTASAEGNYALGEAAVASGDYPAAVKSFERAIAINPALPHIQSSFGKALLFTGDPDAALAAFRKQFSADPSDYDANFHAASILARRGNHPEALTLFDRALTLRPKSPEARLARADSLIALNRTSDATAALAGLVKDVPEYGAAHARLATLYAKAGAPAKAAAERTLAAKYAPAGAPAAGPLIGAEAPRLRLPRADGTLVSVPNPQPGKPAVLVFGSYSCPNFRTAAPALNELSKAWESRMPFLLVYIREAHATDQWQSTRNEREQVQLAPASTAEQKHEYALMCERKLHLRFPSVVDGLDNAAEKAYSAWPSRVYVVSAAGKLVYSSGLTEQEFDRVSLEKAISRISQSTSVR